MYSIVSLPQVFGAPRTALCSALLLCFLVLLCQLDTAWADNAPVDVRNPVVESRGVMQKMEDTSITFRVSNLIELNKEVSDKAEVNVTTVNGIVLLTGSVRTAQDKQWCEDTAREHPKVQKVINELKVRKHRNALDIAKDKALQIATKFRVVRELDEESPTVHVIVYDKTVYLMGVVSKSVAERAADVARKTKSAQRVITIFQFKKDDEATQNPS